MAGPACGQILGFDQQYAAEPDDAAAATTGDTGPAPTGQPDASTGGPSEAGDSSTTPDAGSGAHVDSATPKDSGADMDTSTTATGSPLQAVFSGSTSVESDASSQTVTLATLDPSRSFVVAGTQFDTTASGFAEVTGQISSATELTFARTTGEGAPAVPVQYYVAEFASGVQVQRGSTAMTSTSVNVQLPSSASQATSFPIINYRNTGTTFGDDDFVRATLTGSNVLSLDTGLAADDGVVEWQVVTFDGATVQTGDVSLASTETQATATLSQAVSPSTTWLFLSNEVTGSTGTTAELLVSGRITSSTELTFTRSGPGAVNEITWYAVTFGNGTTVQSATATLGYPFTTATETLSAFTASKSIAVAGGAWLRSGTTEDVASNNPGYGTYTLDITSGTGLTLMRGASGTGTQSSLDYSIITFF
jgi:hypothetical protein